MDIPIQLGPDAGQLADALLGTPVSVWAQGPDLRYVWVFNPALGLSADDVVGMTDYDLHDPETAALVVDVKTRAMKSGMEVREPFSSTGMIGAKRTNSTPVRSSMRTTGHPASPGSPCGSPTSKWRSRMKQTTGSRTASCSPRHCCGCSAAHARTTRMRARPCARRRVRSASIARFHGTLAEGRGDGHVDLQSYLGAPVCSDLAATISQTKTVEIDQDIAPAIFEGRVALKLALIVSELVTNSVKHDKSENGPVRLRVRVEVDDASIG